MSDKLEYPQLHQQMGIHRPTGVRLEMREIGDFRTYDVLVKNGDEVPFILTLFVSPKDYAAFDRVWNIRKELVEQAAKELREIAAEHMGHAESTNSGEAWAKSRALQALADKLDPQEDEE